MKGLLIAVWPIPESLVEACDECPRAARYFVRRGMEDSHLCLRHTVTAIKQVEQEVERG